MTAVWEGSRFYAPAAFTELPAITALPGVDWALLTSSPHILQ